MHKSISPIFSIGRKRTKIPKPPYLSSPPRNAKSATLPTSNHPFLVRRGRRREVMAADSPGPVTSTTIIPTCRKVMCLIRATRTLCTVWVRTTCTRLQIRITKIVLRCRKMTFQVYLSRQSIPRIKLTGVLPRINAPRRASGSRLLRTIQLCASAPRLWVVKLVKEDKVLEGE